MHAEQLRYTINIQEPRFHCSCYIVSLGILLPLSSIQHADNFKTHVTCGVFSISRGEGIPLTAFPHPSLPPKIQSAMESGATLYM